MSLIHAAPANGLEYDVCVVGAGPVGLSLALEAEGLGLRVLVLERGPLDPGKSHPDWSGSSLTDSATHAPLELATHIGLGGTSWLWGGRCVPYEAHDFEARPQCPGVVWPLKWSDVECWYERATSYLGCGPAEFRRALPVAVQTHFQMDGIELTQLERWAKQPRLVGALGARVLAAKGIDILPEAQVEELEFNAQKTQIQSLLLRHGGRNIKVNMRRVVLSGGALGVTQLLLKARLKHPELLGGPDGPLGRYYMGHIMGSIACIVLNRPADFATLDFSADPDGSYVRRRFTPSAQAQRDRALLNTSFYIDNPPFYDHRHRNPTLSLVFLGLAIPPIGRQLVAEAMRLKHIGPAPHRYVAHVLNVLRKPWVAAINVFDILSRRYLSDVRKPGFILENSKGIYALNYHAEQLPNPDSRVTLKNATGDLQVDFRYLPQDAESVLKAHELLDQSMRASGLGHLEFARPAAERLAHIQEQASDGFHQIGTTRMGEGPQQGVVNQDLQVHGIGNLFIASSSVFTTSGEANPTLLAVAMGLRLAAHLSNAAGGTAPDNQL